MFTNVNMTLTPEVQNILNQLDYNNNEIEELRRKKSELHSMFKFIIKQKNVRTKFLVLGCIAVGFVATNLVKLFGSENKAVVSKNNLYFSE